MFAKKAEERLYGNRARWKWPVEAKRKGRAYRTPTECEETRMHATPYESRRFALYDMAASSGIRLTIGRSPDLRKTVGLLASGCNSLEWVCLRDTVSEGSENSVLSVDFYLRIRNAFIDLNYLNVPNDFLLYAVVSPIWFAGS